jgi:micrococcal nuclease
VIARVIDGDTVECREKVSVRLIGIDAPEARQRPFGAASTAALRALLPVGSKVQLESDVQPRDPYRRTLAYIWANGRMVNWTMIRSGWTVLATYPPNVQYVDQLRAAGDTARKEGLGLWKVAGFACMPAAWRQKRCE